MVEIAPNRRMSDIIGIILVLCAAILFYGLTYNRSSYQYILRADEGVSFAASVRVLHGDIPQRDFPYYGPLMPYIYAGAFKIFGTALSVLRASWAGLYILSILLFYRIARLVLPVFPAVAISLILIGQQNTPLYTYNHVGLVLLIEWLVLAMLRASESPARKRYYAEIGGALFLALLVKFNEALVVCLALFLLISAMRYLRSEGGLPPAETLKRLQAGFALAAGLAMAAFVATVAPLNAGLTKGQLLRNFPVLPQYHASIGGYRYVGMIFASALGSLSSIRSALAGWYNVWFDNYLFAIILSLLAGLVIAILFVRLLLARGRNNLDLRTWRLLVVAVVAIALYHEFYLTGNHWSAPLYLGFPLVVLVAVLWHGPAWTRKVRSPLLTVILVVCWIFNCSYVAAARSTFSQFYLDAGRGHIYSSTTSDAPVVRSVVSFLRSSTAAAGSVAAFPHDALLIYLADRRNALRDDDYQWMLFPTEEADRELAQEIQSKKVSAVLVSNFTGIRGGQPVVFGQDYLPQTFDYLSSHYHVAKEFTAPGTEYGVQYLEKDSVDPATDQRSSDLLGRP